MLGGGLHRGPELRQLLGQALRALGGLLLALLDALQGTGHLPHRALHILLNTAGLLGEGLLKLLEGLQGRSDTALEFGTICPYFRNDIANNNLGHAALPSY
jgi:hypothetical protein